MTSSQHPDADRPSDDAADRNVHTSGDGATSTGGDDPNTGSFSGGIFGQGQDRPDDEGEGVFDQGRPESAEHPGQGVFDQGHEEPQDVEEEGVFDQGQGSSSDFGEGTR